MRLHAHRLCRSLVPGLDRAAADSFLQSSLQLDRSHSVRPVVQPNLDGVAALAGTRVHRCIPVELEARTEIPKVAITLCPCGRAVEDYREGTD